MATRRDYQMGRWLAGRLMKNRGWSTVSRRPTGHEHVAIPNYLEPHFAVTQLNQV